MTHEHCTLISFLAGMCASLFASWAVGWLKPTTRRSMRTVVTGMRRISVGDWIATVEFAPGDTREARGDCTVWAWTDTGYHVLGDTDRALLAAWKMAQWAGGDSWSPKAKP